jgi:membrane-associated phospholipid phosphatase
MNNQVAKLISFLFHPLILPSYAVILMFLFPAWLSNYLFEYKKTVILSFILLTLIIPALLLLILLNLRVISNINLNERKDRFLPYTVIFFTYSFGYLLLINFPLGIPPVVSGFVLIADIVILILMVINLKYKISAHMAGIGAFTSFFYVFLLTETSNDTLFYIFNIEYTPVYFIISLIIISGIIASARLYLKAHQLSQVITGFFLGFAIGFLNFWL